MDWRRIIDNCARGDQTSFNEFVNQYYGLLAYLVRRKLPDAADQEDIVQEVLLKFHQRNLFASFRGTTEMEFRAYLSQVCLRTLYAHLSRSKSEHRQLIYLAPEEMAALAGNENDPLAQVLDDERRAQLEEAIRSLPVQYREIVDLRLLGYTHAEIGEILGKPKGTIDSYSQRALGLLRENLQKFASEQPRGGTYERQY